MNRFRRRRLLLRIGIAAPILAYVSVGVAALTWPGFDHATQYISELGGEAAPHPAIFNVGVLVSGVGAGVAGIGFGLSVLALGGARISAAIIALCFGLAGVGLVLSSLYPWPDPRHLAINLGLGIQLAPLAMVWALRRIEDMGRLRVFLLAVFAMHEHQLDDGQHGAWTQPLEKAIQGLQAGVEQHEPLTFSRVLLGPCHRHHAAQRHGQKVIGRLISAHLKFLAALLHGLFNRDRATLGMARAISGQIEHDDLHIRLNAGNSRLEPGRKSTPVTRLTRQAA
jgi:hypothetical membrane protein